MNDQLTRLFLIHALKPFSKIYVVIGIKNKKCDKNKQNLLIFHSFLDLQMHLLESHTQIVVETVYNLNSCVLQRDLQHDIHHSIFNKLITVDSAHSSFSSRTRSETNSLYKTKRISHGSRNLGSLIQTLR